MSTKNLLCEGLPSALLSPIVRLYIYGIHGYFTEVMFTAAWEFVVNTNWKFPGCTSVWSLFIYAICGFGIEQMYLGFNGKIAMPLRGIIYLLWTYSWEFTTGSILSYFNACPWDYTAFDYHLMGLVTLEYAPLWYLATLVQEQMLTKNILLLQWSTLNNNNVNTSQNNYLELSKDAGIEDAGNNTGVMTKKQF